ncbi:MAG: hypothetical protein J0H57_10240 [Rhodospirillales bacterium]|nr:hypothetical protein [Rhodospirillales bacterium]
MVAIGAATLLWRRREIVSGRGIPSTPPSHDSLESGYEVKDISVRGVSYVLVAIGAAVAVSLGVVFLFVGRFEAARSASFQGLTAEQTAVAVTPAPHLQFHPHDDLAEVRLREQRLLQGYGWADRDHTRAHIPIERAMALMVGRSLDPVP